MRVVDTPSTTSHDGSMPRFHASSICAARRCSQVLEKAPSAVGVSEESWSNPTGTHDCQNRDSAGFEGPSPHPTSTASSAFRLPADAPVTRPRFDCSPRWPSAIAYARNPASYAPRDTPPLTVRENVEATGLACACGSAPVGEVATTSAAARTAI